jgi:hypothetical protein
LQKVEKMINCYVNIVQLIITMASILKLILIRHAESEENVRFEALRLRFRKGIRTMPLPEAL